VNIELTEIIRLSTNFWSDVAANGTVEAALIVMSARGLDGTANFDGSKVLDAVRRYSESSGISLSFRDESVAFDG
jgi:hypothetical protein